MLAVAVVDTALPVVAVLLPEALLVLSVSSLEPPCPVLIPAAAGLLDQIEVVAGMDSLVRNPLPCFHMDQ